MNVDVIVIGAGNAGLAAVHTLRQQGADVLCLEAGDIPGGRTISVKRSGYILDFGSQFVFRFNRRFFDLCSEVGLKGEVVPWAGLVHSFKGGRMIPAMVGATPTDLWRNRARLRGMHKALGPRAAWQLMRLLPTIHRKSSDLDFVDYAGALDLDGENYADFIRRLGGAEVLETLFQPNVSAMTLGMPEEVSAAYGLALFWQSSKGYWTLKHGIGALNERLFERYKDCIRLKTPAKRIVIEDGRVLGVETADGLIEARRVICTTTGTTALKLMPDLPDTLRRPLEKVRYSACCHVIFATGEIVLPKDFYAVGLPRNAGSIMAGYTNSSVKSEYYAPTGCGLINCFTFDRHAVELNARPDDEVEKICLSEVQRFSPAMPDSYEFCAIWRWKEAVNLSPPGMLSAMQHLRQKNYRDVAGLFLGGDYLYMPSVDGSIHSGITAAKAALA